MRATVTIMLKDGVLDPQGEAVYTALLGLGFAGIEKVTQGKVIELYLPDNFDPKSSMVVPSLIRKAYENEVVSVWGDGSPIRDFIYAGDVASGMLHMVENKVTEADKKELLFEEMAVIKPYKGKYKKFKYPLLLIFLSEINKVGTPCFFCFS